jgi:Flp pilus assembly pilin Flp
MALRARAGCEDGQTTAEYAFLLGLVTLVLIATFSAFGLAVVRLLEGAAQALMP